MWSGTGDSDPNFCMDSLFYISYGVSLSKMRDMKMQGKLKAVHFNILSLLPFLLEMGLLFSIFCMLNVPLPVSCISAAVVLSNLKKVFLVDVLALEPIKDSNIYSIACNKVEYSLTGPCSIQHRIKKHK